MDQMKIGTFLKALRKEKYLTQAQLAEQLNISGRTVSRWETGKNMPVISILVELAEFYHVTVDYLVREDGNSIKIIGLYRDSKPEDKEEIIFADDHCITGNDCIYRN